MYQESLAQTRMNNIQIACLILIEPSSKVIILLFTKVVILNNLLPEYIYVISLNLLFRLIYYPALQFL